ncbi:MAG TPA: nucleoside transporter C-terminal domain-containing protein, partial [Nannocystis sp.]
LTALLRDAGALGADQRVTLDVLFGWVLAPIAWLMGVPWEDAVQVGALLGIKTVLNEFVAYLQLSSLLAEGELSPRSILIATYALCGFANFSSIAIQIGGIGGIAPSRRSDLSRLGLRAMIGGTLAAFMTATVAGMLI